MQIIKKASSRIAKAWGSQKIKDTQYRLLRYTLSEDYEEGLLLHNAMTGELLKLDEKEKAFLNSLPQTVPEEYNALIEKHFLVPVEYDEQKAVAQLRRILRVLNRSSSITSYTILPTTHCNARCFYCYECNYEHVHMTEERAHEVVQYILDHSDGKKLSIGWFGGEPLVGVRIISQISRELTEKGAEFTSHMISNGALFNEKMVKEAVDLWKLQNVQITIDGTEEIYNRVKDYISMKGSPYQTVLGNIRLLSETGIHVSIRINLGFHNEADTRTLIRELSERFADCENVTMYVHELFDGEGTDPHLYTEEEKEHLMNLVTEFNDYAAENGKYLKKRALPFLTIAHCMADNDRSVIIQPGGELAKCEHSAAVEKFGSIYSDEWDKENLQGWKQYATLEECENCPLYPSCIYPVKCPSTGECRAGMKRKKIEEVRESMLYAAEQSEKQSRDSE